MTHTVSGVPVEVESEKAGSVLDMTAWLKNHDVESVVSHVLVTISAKSSSI